MRILTLFLVILFVQDAWAAFTWWGMPPHEVREMINKRIMEVEASTMTVSNVIDRVIQQNERETPIRIYVPNGQTHFPIILLIHGGAWVAGNLDTHDNLARYLCAKTEALVVSVGYLNSPEGKFPLPLQQCDDALMWIVEHAGEFSADSSRLAIVGDSAGGNLTAALCLMTRDLGRPEIALQVLINPALDLTCEGTFHQQDDVLDIMRWQALHYLSNSIDAYNPYVSPLIAENLRHLPPALILVAEKDFLRESGEQYADRLSSAGVSNFVYCQQGVAHLAGHGARASSLAKESLEVAVKQIRTVFENLRNVE